MNRYWCRLAAAFIGGGVAGWGLNRGERSCVPTCLEAALPVDRNRPAVIMKYGFPTSNSSLKIRKNYVLSYDNRLRNATWVFEHINKDLLSEKDSDRMNSSFVADSSIHKYFRSTNEDYYKSGYDRGHIAAASNHRADQGWMDETFYLSNILPQNSFLNRYAWNKLEKHIRKLAYFHDNIYVCTGPLYLPKKNNLGKTYVSYEVIGPNYIAVPTHYFKVVVCERASHLEILSYIVPNEWVDPAIPLEQFLYPIEMIERASGILLLNGIPQEKVVKINGHKVK